MAIVLAGVVLGMLLGFLSQWALDSRRLRRDDFHKFELERLALYRDLLDVVQRTPYAERFEGEKMRASPSRMELLSSRAVVEHAYEAFNFAETVWKAAHGEIEVEYPEEDVPDIEEHLLELTYRFTREIRRELGVTTKYRPTVLTHKGKRRPGGPPRVAEAGVSSVVA